MPGRCAVEMGLRREGWIGASQNITRQFLSSRKLILPHSSKSFQDMIIVATKQQDNRNFSLFSPINALTSLNRC